MTVTFGADQIRTQTTQASLTVTPCSADFNGGGLGPQDLFDFLAAFFAQNNSSGAGLSADFNHTNNVVGSPGTELEFAL